MLFGYGLVIAGVVTLHNPVFNAVACDDSITTIGTPLGKPIHPNGDTVIRIDRVLFDGTRAGFIFTNADDQRYYGPLPRPNPESIRGVELAFMRANLPAKYRSQTTIADTVPTYFVPFHIVPKGYSIEPCVAADLKGH
jgi:hypothetical protein